MVSTASGSYFLVTQTTLQVGENYLPCKPFKCFTLAPTVFIVGNLAFVGKLMEDIDVSCRLLQGGDNVDLSSGDSLTSSVTKKNDHRRPRETTRTWQLWLHGVHRKDLFLVTKVYIFSPNGRV